MSAERTSGGADVPASRPGHWRRWVKPAVAAILALCVVAAYGLWGDRIQLEALARHEARLRAIVVEQPLLAGSTAFGIYVLVTGLSLPGASILTPLLGWLFGFWRGLLLASFAATAGATVAFLLSRYLLRETIERRFGEQLGRINAALERDGAWYLLTLRLVPAFPFFVINLVMGLTKMPVATYWWVSQLGMLPGACVFVYAGASVPTLAELSRSAESILSWRLAFALAALGLLPLLLRILLQRMGRSPRRLD